MMLGDVLKGRTWLRLTLLVLALGAITLNVMRWEMNGPSSDFIPIPLIGIVIAACLIGILFVKHDSRIRSARRHLVVGTSAWLMFICLAVMCGTLYGGLLGPMSHAECVNGKPTSVYFALPWTVNVQRYARAPNAPFLKARCLTAEEAAQLSKD